MRECLQKDSCPYLGYASAEEVLAEKERLERQIIHKDELIALATQEIQKRDERIKDLEAQIEVFKEALKDAHQEPFKKGKKGKKEEDSDEDNPSEKQPKKRGAPKGHRGATRPKPEHIDEYRDVYAGNCTRCGSGNIKHSGRFEDHIQEDIVLIVTKATCFRHFGFYCYDCQYTGFSGPAEDEIPGAFIGPGGKSAACHMRYQIGMTYGQVKKALADFFGLKLTRPALVGFDKAVCEKGKPFYEMLKQRMYLSSHCCVDETGWLVLETGSEWLWVFTNDLICLYVINEHRSSQVVKLVLGDTYLGIIVSDCFSSYNPISAGGKQKCVVHILRKNKEVAEYPEIDNQIQEFTITLKGLFQEALELKEKWRSGEVTEEDLSSRAEDFKDKLEEITSRELSYEEAEKLRNRLIKHKDELFTFLTHPHVPADNNLAERSLRPCVIHRKLMYFNTTEEGARHYEVIMSLTQTAKRNGQGSMELMKKLLTGAQAEDVIGLLLGDRAKEHQQKVTSQEAHANLQGKLCSPPSTECHTCRDNVPRTFEAPNPETPEEMWAGYGSLNTPAGNVSLLGNAAGLQGSRTEPEYAETGSDMADQSGDEEAECLLVGSGHG